MDYRKCLKGVGAFALGAFLYANTAGAVGTSFPAGALLQPNDVTTTHVRDNTLTDEDVSDTANISATRINPRGTRGNLIYSDGTKIASTTKSHYDPTAHSLVVGSSTPSITATSSGSVYASGKVEASNLTATSTLTLGTTTLSVPVNTPVSGDVLKLSSGSALTWGSSGDWVELYATTTTFATSSVIASGFTARQFYRAVLYVPGMVTDAIRMHFNHDYTGTLGVRRSVDGGADATSAGSGNAQCSDVGAAGARLLVLDIANFAGSQKTMVGHETVAGVAAAAPTRADCSIVWNNTSAQINELFFGPDGANTMNAGTVLKVYGSKD